MILQLNPSIYVDTPLGKGHALFLIDYGMHQNSCWIVTLEDNGIVKHFDANDIIICTNFTYHINNERNGFTTESEEPKRV
ncbi:hypothetical protein EDC17_103524 [Sphingobacterium alimentarium]|uniref:Uncharacterized protein n=1 Tax=Sphingobacterium alimentarium TaxID=797292 RepID=A0A4R3VU58_9SPHI|nr:hypothetical protein [Sphingobacterium alimentarium]TCV10256.1 hypothetical protein EDC17_103524 [Sphingobacterium alimentarium]